MKSGDLAVSQQQSNLIDLKYLIGDDYESFSRMDEQKQLDYLAQSKSKMVYDYIEQKKLRHYLVMQSSQKHFTASKETLVNI